MGGPIRAAAQKYSHALNRRLHDQALQALQVAAKGAEKRRLEGIRRLGKPGKAKWMLGH